MKWKTLLSERALTELVESWEWYEDRQQGLGDRFKNLIFDYLRQLEEDPTKGVKRHQVFREVIVRTFPFLIIYRIEKESQTIFIHSIFHTMRNPRKKYRS